MQHKESNETIKNLMDETMESTTIEQSTGEYNETGNN